MSEAVLRTMLDADLPAVQRLEKELFPEDAWSEAMFREELAGCPATRYYVVAEEPDGRLVGYAGLAAVAGQGDVQTIGVCTDRRRSGVGAALLTELLDEAVRRECEAVFLEVRADNGPAHRLYERFGFVRVGVRKRYYQPANVDAIVMRRELRRRPAVGFTRGNQ